MKALRGQVLHFVDDPGVAGESAYQFFEDGVVVIDNGRIQLCGDYAEVQTLIPAHCVVHEHKNHLILPGFIDTHVHYPQTGIIGAHGEELLNWLNEYAFPEELKFANEQHCSEVADFFLDELLRNGTTTALVFATVHRQSVDAFFQSASRRKMRMISGKVLMDRNAPPGLCDTPEIGYAESSQLIEQWHGNGRLLYAITPRFAPCCSTEQFATMTQLRAEYPDVYIHSHLSENRSELDWVAELFPESSNYLQVYDDAKLLGDRSVFAHGIHLSGSECQRIGETQTTIAHCPSSNLFLGSGLFDFTQLQQHGAAIGVGTDVGAGTGFSLVQTLGDAYKVQKLQGKTLDPLYAFYLATLGGAKALALDEHIGNFKEGKEADLSIIDLQATPLLAFRLDRCNTLLDTLSALITMGDDRLISETYIMGERAYARAEVH